jgi:hypothetical protein
MSDLGQTARVQVGWSAGGVAIVDALAWWQSFPATILLKKALPMEKETTITPTPTLPKVPPRTEAPVRTMRMDKARKLIRKTSAEHAGLFRRLAK